MTPTGLSQSYETRGNTQAEESAVLWAVPSMHETDEQTAELLAVWAMLDATGRDDVLAVARGLSARQRT